MTINQVEKLANKLISQTYSIRVLGTIGVPQVNVNIESLGYKFIWSPRAKRRAGQCNYKDKTISLSLKLIEENLDRPDSIEDTIRHEIAHAISHHIYGRRGAGHNYLWKDVAIQVGAKPNRCYDRKKYKAVNGKYTIKCPSCGHSREMHRRPKKSRSCGICYPQSYNPDYKMILIQNY